MIINSKNNRNIQPGTLLSRNTGFVLVEKWSDHHHAYICKDVEIKDDGEVIERDEMLLVPSDLTGAEVM